MAIRTSIRAAALAALVIATGLAPAAPVLAAEPQIPGVSLGGTDATTRSVPLVIGKSLVYDFPRDIKDVLVADPKTANVVIRSSRRAYIIGIVTGETSIVFFDAGGMQMARFEITVMDRIKIKPQRYVSNIEKEIRNLLCPHVQCDDVVKVVSIGDGILLKGTVANQLEAQQAFDIASHFIDPCAALGNNGSGSGSGSSSSSSSISECSGGGGALNGVSASKIVNAIVVRGSDQVMLKVTVAEVSRQVIKQLGINLSGSAGIGSSVVNFNNTNPFPINGPPGALSIAPALTPNNVLSPLSTAQSLIPSPFAAGNIGGTSKSLTANLQAMDQAGVIHVLAEPNLTAISGETANFLVGGQFPYPIPPQSVGQAPGYDFKNFGVSLKFTPVVLSEGRISLKVLTEVSELAPENSVTISGTTVPGLTVRRAETTVEIPSGGSLAMAGMIQEETKQTITGFPGLMNVPILGALFKSRDYRNNQTELMILVTPYIVHAVAQKQLSRPDDGFADPNDQSAVLLGRLNRIYGAAGKTEPPPSEYHGKYGFILD
jgi:pilus assembly protein CpaC